MNVTYDSFVLYLCISICYHKFMWISICMWHTTLLFCVFVYNLYVIINLCVYLYDSFVLCLCISICYRKFMCISI